MLYLVCVYYKDLTHILGSSDPALTLNRTWPLTVAISRRQPRLGLRRLITEPTIIMQVSFVAEETPE
jgi:hypothetical protein